MADHDENLPEVFPSGSNESGEPNGFLVPCKPSEFGSFLAGLLQMPKTLRYSRSDPFVLRFSDIEDFDRLVDQRIEDQQKFSKLSVELAAYYNDGTSAHCSSLEEFSNHSSLGKELCTKVTIDWVYLIDFPNAKTPHKQEVHIEFSTKYGPNSRKHSELDIRNVEAASFFGSSFIEFSIRHSHVTFGHDLANILKNRIGTLIKEQRVEKILSSTWVKIPWALLFALAGVGFSSLAATSLNSLYSGVVTRTGELPLEPVFINSIVYAAGTTIVLTFGILSAGMALHDAITKNPASYIVLNEDHSKALLEAERKRKRNWLTVGATTVATLVLGTMGSLIASGIWEAVF